MKPKRIISIKKPRNPKYIAAAKRHDVTAMNLELPMAMRTESDADGLVSWAAQWSPCALNHLIENAEHVVVRNLPLVAMRAVEQANMSSIAFFNASFCNTSRSPCLSPYHEKRPRCTNCAGGF